MKNKPSKEELEQKEQEAIKVAEELEGRQSIPQDETEEVEPPKVELDDETQSDDPQKEVQKETEPEVEEQATPSPDYKKKFSESSREAQKKTAANRIINKAILEAEEIPEPTEEELKTEYGDDWELMSDTEKRFAKEAVISRNWRKVIFDAKNQAEKIEKWNESVEEYVSDPKTLIDNPELEGKTNEFIEFATQDANNNVPFNLLVGAFLHEQAKAKSSHKGRMFESGSGGPNDKPQPQKKTITLDQARQLRETDYAKWKEYNNKGLIEYDL